jgi:hypothetical protein
MTKSFQAAEIVAAANQGTSTARRSFMNAAVNKPLRLVGCRRRRPAGNFRLGRPILEKQALAAQATARVATSTAARYPERFSGGQNRCCELEPEVVKQLRETARLASAVLFPDLVLLPPVSPTTSPDARVAEPVRRLFVMLNRAAKEEFAL